MLPKVVGADGDQLTPSIAAPFSISGGTATDADGGFNFALTGDTTSRSAASARSENDEAADNLIFLSTSFTDPNATYAVSPGSVTMNGIGFRERSALFTLSDPTFACDIASTHGTSAARKGYSFAFDVGEVFGPDKSIGGFDLNYIPAAPISPLRQRLIHEMTMREFSRTKQTNDTRDVGRFARFLARRPDTATQAAGRVEPRRGCPTARRDHLHQASVRLVGGLRGGPACRRGGSPQDQRYRQRAHAHLSGRSSSRFQACAAWLEELRRDPNRPPLRCAGFTSLQERDPQSERLAAIR